MAARLGMIAWAGGWYRYVAVLWLGEDSDGSGMMVVLQRGLVIVCDGQRV